MICRFEMSICRYIKKGILVLPYIFIDKFNIYIYKSCIKIWIMFNIEVKELDLPDLPH